MLFEYAIEPQYVAECDQQIKRNLLESVFGVGTPRVICFFPNKQEWKQSALTQVKKLKRTRDVKIGLELIEALSRKVGIKRDGIIPGSGGWIHQIVSLHLQSPFKAVIVRENQLIHAQHPEFISDNSVCDKDNPQWHAPTTITVSRKAKPIAKALEPALLLAKHIILIDPYYGRPRDGHQKVLHEICKIVNSRPNKPETFECHGKKHPYDNHDLGLSDETFRLFVTEKLKPALLPGMSLTVRRWEERRPGKELHGRFLLTELGLIDLDPGLDAGEDGQECRLGIRSLAEHSEMWQSYRVNPAFNVAYGDGSIELIGE